MHEREAEQGGALFPPARAARLIGVSVSLIYTLCRSGRLPHYRVGCRGRGKMLIREEDLRAFVESCRIDGVPQDDGTLKYIR